MITVEHLSRQYGSFKAVDDVSFQIGKGEVVGLLGHNGAGKTTIMKMLTGYLQPTCGHITIDGLRMDQEPELIKARIGYLPEVTPTYPDLNVIQYLEFAAQLKKIPVELIPNSLRNVIQQTCIESQALTPIRTLSRGYKQRVGVAQALLGKPKVIILDEPTNGLDPTQIEHMRDLIQDLASYATVIVSTHIMQEVQASCSRVLILKEGKLSLDAPLSQLQTGHRLHIKTNATAAIIRRCFEHKSWFRDLAIIEQAGDRFSYQLTFINLDQLTQTDILENICAEVSRTLVHEHCEVYSIHPEHRDLEAIFKEITLSSATSEVNRHAA